MEMKEYLTFDLMLQGQAGDYRALIIDSPAGQDRNQFEMLFQPDQLTDLLNRISMNDQAAAKELGQGLFDTVYDARLQSLLNRSLDEAERQAKGLRIRLRLSINGKYLNESIRFSITPYIVQWERDQFIAKDHEGKEFFLRRIG